MSKGKLINLIKRTWRYYYAVIWHCIQNIMRQNSIMHGQIFNFYYFKKQTHTHMHTHYNARTRAHTYTHIYGTALQTLPLLDKSFSKRITGKVFKFCFINLPVRYGISVLDLNLGLHFVVFAYEWLAEIDGVLIISIIGHIALTFVFQYSIKTPFPNRILLREYNQVCYS